MEGIVPILAIMVIAFIAFVVLWFIKKISSLLLTIISGILVVFIVIMLFMIVSDIANKPVPYDIIEENFSSNITTGIKALETDNGLLLKIAQDGATNLTIKKIMETAGNKVLINIDYQNCNVSRPVNWIMVTIPKKYENYTFLLTSEQVPCQ